MIAWRATFVLGSYQRYENPHALKPVRGRESPQFNTYSSGVREGVKSKKSQQNLYLINSWKAKTSSRGMPVISRDYYYALSDWRKSGCLQRFTAMNPHTLIPNPHTLKLKSTFHIPQIKTESPHFKTWCEESVNICVSMSCASFEPLLHLIPFLLAPDQTHCR